MVIDIRKCIGCNACTVVRIAENNLPPGVTYRTVAEVENGAYLERWEFHGSHPSIPQKAQPVRNPAAAPLTETVSVFGEKLPISLESMILGIAEKLGLPGFGKNGLGQGRDFTRPEDFYLPMVANVAAGDKPGDEVPDANDEEKS